MTCMFTTACRNGSPCTTRAKGNIACASVTLRFSLLRVALLPFLVSGIPAFSRRGIISASDARNFVLPGQRHGFCGAAVLIGIAMRHEVRGVFRAKLERVSARPIKRHQEVAEERSRGAESLERLLPSRCRSKTARLEQRPQHGSATEPALEKCSSRLREEDAGQISLHLRCSEHFRFENAPGVERSEIPPLFPLPPVSPQFTCGAQLRLQA